MSRFKFGPKITPAEMDIDGIHPSVAAAIAAGAVDAVAKADVDVAFVGVRGNLVDFQVAPSDLAVNNHLLSVNVVLVPQGHGLPADPTAAMGSDYQHFSVDTSANQAGGLVTCDGSQMLTGKYTALSVEEYDV
jgi:hypothetical protein